MGLGVNESRSQTCPYGTGKITKKPRTNTSRCHPDKSGPVMGRRGKWAGGL
jgi:hypothetical protein